MTNKNIPVSIIDNNIATWVDLSDRWAEVFYISEDEHNSILENTHIFDIETKKVIVKEVEEIVEEENKSIPSLAPRQIRLALLHSGIDLDIIDNMIESLPEDKKPFIKVMRNNSGTFLRNDPDLVAFSSALWMSEEQVDELFLLWSTL